VEIADGFWKRHKSDETFTASIKPALLPDRQAKGTTWPFA